MTDKASKVEIVTGASRGVGAAVVEQLATDGFAVLISPRRNACTPRTWADMLP
jgi:3-oxoacyl-[acyl-carrier protein] reductase